MKIIEKNILDVKEGLIFQQVNCMGVMGSGLARAIRDKYPIVFEYYKQACDEYDLADRWKLLGTCLAAPVADNLTVMNIFSQLNYGIGTKHTEYSAISEGLESAFQFRQQCKNKQVCFPHFFGCGLGGGDWEVVSKIIEFYFTDAIICKI